MILRATRRHLLLGSLALSLSLESGALAQEQVELTFLIPSGAASEAVAQSLIDAFQAANPDITIEIETRPGGAEGDNIVKTRLATGEMTDVFSYNSGSLFQAINPTRNLVPVTNESFVANLLDPFRQVVTANGDVYGVPIEAAMGGGVLYNRPIYEELGLEIPKTWDEFMANNQAIKDVGKVAVIQTFGETWTSQLFVLGDFANVLAEEPDFAERYTNNEAKYATSDAARAGFEKQQQVFEAGYLNEDFAAAVLDDGLRMVATGEGVHYPMLTFAVNTIAELYPDNLDDVGFFALPGDNAEENSLTTWMPAAVYIAQNSEHQEEAKRFLAFIASPEGCEAMTDAGAATGPYMVEGCTLPEDVPQAVSDLLPYFEEGGNAAPALEFLSPIKGPALEQITVEVGSGIRSAAEGAALYDEDVRKQAQQLGLPNW